MNESRPVLRCALLFFLVVSKPCFKHLWVFLHFRAFFNISQFMYELMYKIWKRHQNGYYFFNISFSRRTLEVVFKKVCGGGCLPEPAMTTSPLLISNRRRKWHYCSSLKSVYHFWQCFEKSESFGKYHFVKPRPVLFHDYQIYTNEW